MSLYSDLKIQFGELIKNTFLQNTISISQTQELAEFFTDHFDDKMTTDELKTQILLMKLQFPSLLHIINTLSYV